MKALVICFFLILTAFGLSAQEKTRRVRTDWKQWSDSIAFFQGPVPLVMGYGALSDTLSSLYHGKAFFEYNEKYYVINSLADYYFWFTAKYSFLFKKDVETYKEYYTIGDDFNMARFIQENYTGKRLPVKFKFYVPSERSYPLSEHVPLSQRSMADY